MILDATVLLHAVDDTSPHHPTATGFVDEHFSEVRWDTLFAP